MLIKQVPAFVADIAQHIDQVWKPAATRQLVALHKVGSNRLMFVLRATHDPEATDRNNGLAAKNLGKAA